MNQPTTQAFHAENTENTEALFRRVMAGATDRAWSLGVDEEALAALHDVIDEATRRGEAGQQRRDEVPE